MNMTATASTKQVVCAIDISLVGKLRDMLTW